MFARILVSLLLIFTAIFLPGNSFAKSDTTSTPSTILRTSPLSTSPSASQSATPIPAYTQLPPTVYPTSPVYTDLMVHNLFHSFSCLAVGQSIIGQPCLTYQFTQNAQGVIQGVPMLAQVNLSGGALGTTSSLIEALYLNRPVRTADYLTSVGQGMGIVKTANAQVVGSGAQVLSPILSLWQVSRNITYVFMILIFLIIGLMIMFRNKLNPQTVITAQAALPGLVIGLIMITFSYFFAGLITDMAFVGTNIVGHYFAAAQKTPTNQNPTPKLISDIKDENVGSIFSKYVGMLGSGDISGLINSILSSLDGNVQMWVRLFAGIIGFQVGSAFGGPIGEMLGPTTCAATGVGALVAPLCGVIGGLVGKVVGGTAIGLAVAAKPGEIFGLLLYFVAIAVLIYTMFKLLLKLITVYLNIIFLTITAPFQFLAASLPGRQGIVTSWMLSMLANILAFPAVFAIFYFVAYLLGPDQSAGKFFGINSVHNLTGTTGATLPLLGGLNLNFINALVAFGALVATPSIPDVISRALGKFSQAGQLLGQEIGAGTKAGQGYAGRLGAVPGQAMGGLTPARELGAKYTTVIGKDGKPVIIKTPGLRGYSKGPEIFEPPRPKPST